MSSSNNGGIGRGIDLDGVGKPTEHQMRLGQTPVGFTGHLTLHMMHDMTGAAKMYRHLSFRLIVVIEKSIAFHKCTQYNTLDRTTQGVR